MTQMTRLGKMSSVHLADWEDENKEDRLETSEIEVRIKGHHTKEDNDEKEETNKKFGNKETKTVIIIQTHLLRI